MPGTFNERLQIETHLQNKSWKTQFITSHRVTSKWGSFSISHCKPSIYSAASGVLPTALVPIQDDSSTITVCRALTNSGSQLSLSTESTVQRMHLKRRTQWLTVNGIGNVSRTYNSGSVILRLKHKNGTKVINVHAFVLPSLTQLLPNRSFEMYSQFHMRTIGLADRSFNVSSQVDLILESDGRGYHLRRKIHRKLWVTFQ